MPARSIHAALHDKHGALELLLQAGADVHATTTSGDTALHWAAYKVRGCLQRGGPPCAVHAAPSNQPKRPWLTTTPSPQGHYKCASLLIQNAANIDAVGHMANRPLHVAAAAGHARVSSGRVATCGCTRATL